MMERAAQGWTLDKVGNVLLLLFGASTVLVAPLFPESLYKVVYNVHFTAILLAAVMTLKQDRRVLLIGALIITAVDIWAAVSGSGLILAIGRGLNVLFFLFIVITLISTIMKTRHVSALVILNAVNAYLLLGLVFGLIAAIVAIHDPAAYSYVQDDTPLGEIMYYAFITFTTVGYGDYLPVGRFARSLAVLTGISGQMYVAIVIAMLVGKFASTPAKNDA